MKNRISNMASKKLAFSGSCAGLIIAHAEKWGWQAWHGYSVAFIAGLYCLGVGIQEGLSALSHKDTPKP